MSTPAPWSYQTGSEVSGNVKLFNPGQSQIPQTDGNLPEQNHQTNWGSQWGSDNQYGQYNYNGSQQEGQGHDQIDFQGTGMDSQQYYNLNPGIHTQAYQGQPYQQEGQIYQQYDPQGQPMNQYDSQGQPTQNFQSQGQIYDPNYGWNNQYYGYQQTWNNTVGQQLSVEVNDGEMGKTVNSETNKFIESQSQNVHNGFENDSNVAKCEVTEYIDHRDKLSPQSDVKNNEISPQENTVFSNKLHPEISDESLVTLNSSSTQLGEDNSQSNIENQMENLTIQEKSNKVEKNSGDVNHLPMEGQVPSSDNSKPNESKDSPVNSQTSDDWEMVPSAHNLLAPNTHSRQGSADSSSNVHFFIGSVNVSPSGTPSRSENEQSDTKTERSSPTSNLIPRHSSSPMKPKSDAPSSQSNCPPLAPPSGTGVSSGNPFKKGNSLNTKDRKSLNQTKVSGNEAGNISNSQSRGLKLDIVSAESFPSPIPAVTEDINANNPPTQSPIMPRKESPFQPPRRRNLSQSSNSFDDDNVGSHLEQRNAGVNKSDNDPRKSGPMKADRSIDSMMNNQSIATRRHEVNIDYKFSGHGKDEKRPSFPYSSNSDRNLVSDRKTPTKPPTGRITPTKPSGRTTPGRNTPSRRMEHAAYQKVLERRRKENVSPATSLWANNDVVQKTNILLAPAAPLPSAVPVLGILAPKTGAETREVLSPVENLITSMSDNLSRENSPEKEMLKPKSKERESHSHRRENTQKDKHERNSSIDREIEMTKRMEENERVHENSRERAHKDDRNNRGPVRDDRYRDGRDYRDRERDRDYERERYYEAYYERQRNNRSRDPYYDERYERPRSRQSTMGDSAPSRQDQDRGHYDRDAYYKDRYSRDYYNYYGNSRGQYGYNDQRYADYYGDSRYSKGYYDEYYGGQYNDNYDRMSRYDYTWQNAGYYDQYRNDDTYSQRSNSRAHTPGSLSDSGDQLEGYMRGSRSASRQGYGDEYNRGQYDPYYYGYSDYYGNSYAEPEVPGRMTPEKYTFPHVCARFGPGGHLIKILPNRPKEGQPATVEIHDISMMLEDQPEVEDLKCFPGPLVRGDTHKNDVLSFCQQKAKACSENINLTDRDSAELIWKLLEVLIKQNGMVVGTDIADLLLEGHEPTTVEYSMMGMKISSSTDNLENDMEESLETSNVVMDRSVVNKGHRSREEVTDRFRHLLLYGRKKDALEWAMKNSLWGHALFLASKMDSKAHANVMTRFANSAMKMNDPLQTLYQLMSGRQPAAVSCITDERWGDWRPHLAMMLSNQTHKSDLDRKCILIMGDTLASKGFLHASHFCYLMAQVGFGSYHKKTSKMVLIGSNHSLSLSEFATNEAIQCSEVYEYAMSLGNSSFFSPNLQYFKYLYACRLAESGFAQKALEYCEVIAKYVNISPTVFQPTLVKLVFELADRLKKFDPEKQHVGEDSEDPLWLQNLQRINQGFEDGSIQPLSGSVTPYFFMGTRSSSASGEVAGLTEMAGMQSGNYTGSSPYPQGQQMYNQAYNTEQAQNQLYSDQPYYQGQGYNQIQNPDFIQNNSQYGEHIPGQSYNADQFQGHHPVQNQQQTVDQGQEHKGQGDDHSGHGQAYASQMYSQQQHELPHQHTHQYSTQEGQQAGFTYQHHDLSTVPESTIQSQEYSENQTEDTSTHQQHNNYLQQNDFSMYNQAGIQSGQRHSISSAGTVSSHADTDDEEGLGHSQRNDFDYFGAATNHQQKIVAPRLRKRTESESSTVGGPKPSEPSRTDKTEKIPESNSNEKSQGKGWFGGVFSKLMQKSKNEMKLPDDKNPAIVWDPVKKKWVNQDGDEEDEKPPAPPPKDMDLSSTPAPAPLLSAPSAGPPTGNRFARPRGRGARTQYVDVMNPKPVGGSASVPSNIFNVMPTSASSPAIFNPSHGNDITDSSQQETDTAQTNMPPSDQRIDSREKESTEMAPPSGPPAQPVLFNPSQVSTSKSIPQQGLKRYNQRRVYPKS